MAAASEQCELACRSVNCAVTEVPRVEFRRREKLLKVEESTKPTQDSRNGEVGGNTNSGTVAGSEGERRGLAGNWGRVYKKDADRTLSTYLPTCRRLRMGL